MKQKKQMEMKKRVIEELDEKLEIIRHHTIEALYRLEWDGMPRTPAKRLASP